MSAFHRRDRVLGSWFRMPAASPAMPGELFSGPLVRIGAFARWFDTMAGSLRSAGEARTSDRAARSDVSRTRRGTFAAVIVEACATLAEWRRRARSRRELQNLSPAEFKDLSCHSDVRGEMQKPFWKP